MTSAARCLQSLAAKGAAAGSLLACCSSDTLASADAAATALRDNWHKAPQGDPRRPVAVAWLMLGSEAEDGALLAAVITLHTLCVYDVAAEDSLRRVPEVPEVTKLQRSTWRLLIDVLNSADGAARHNRAQAESVEPSTRARRLARAAARGLLRSGLLDALPRAVAGITAQVSRSLGAAYDTMLIASIRQLLYASFTIDTLRLVESLCVAAAADSSHAAWRDELLNALGHSQVRPRR